MLTYLEARDAIRHIAKPFATERVKLSQALNRVLAQPVYADRDYPPFNRAAMDGIAIRFCDWDEGTREFHIQQTIFAGMGVSTSLMKRACYKIMTGAACPDTVDTVIRMEDLAFTERGTVIVRSESISIGQHIARQGEDLAKGELTFTAPRICDVSLIGVLAALGIDDVPVYAMPTVAIITTGNEVIAVDQQPQHFQIRNSNRHLLQALCQQWQLPVQYCQHVSDDPKALSATLNESLKYQLILINGGVSAGDADYVPQILQAMGINILFHKVSIKPGKPLLAASLPTGAMIFALPGNPISCFMTFKLFVEEYLHHCLNFSKERFIKTALKNLRSKKSALDEFFPVFRSPDNEGHIWKPNHGSGDITATVGCDGIGWHPHHKQVIHADDTIAVLSLQPFFNVT